MLRNKGIGSCIRTVRFKDGAGLVTIVIGEAVRAVRWVVGGRRNKRTT